MRDVLSTTLDMTVDAVIFDVQMLFAPQSFWLLHARKGEPEHSEAFTVCSVYVRDTNSQTYSFRHCEAELEWQKSDPDRFNGCAPIALPTASIGLQLAFESLTKTGLKSDLMTTYFGWAVVLPLFACTTENLAYASVLIVQVGATHIKLALLKTTATSEYTRHIWDVSRHSNMQR